MYTTFYSIKAPLETISKGALLFLDEKGKTFKTSNNLIIIKYGTMENKIWTKIETSFKHLLFLLLMGMPLAGYSCMYSFPTFLWGIELSQDDSHREIKVIPKYDFIFSDTDVSNVEKLYSSVVLWYNDLPRKMNSSKEILYIDILVGEHESDRYYKNIEKLGKLMEQKLDRKVKIIADVVQFDKFMPVSMNKIIFAGLESYTILPTYKTKPISVERILTFTERHPVPKVFEENYSYGDSYYFYSTRSYPRSTMIEQPELSYKINSKRKRIPPIAPHAEIRLLFLYETEDNEESEKDILQD
jgi:hypothetical protein